MKINAIVILIGLLWTICIYRGYKRGFAKIAMSLVSTIVVMVFVTWATPYISDFIEKNTTIDDQIEAECEKNISARLLEYGEPKEAFTDLPLPIRHSIEKITKDAGKAALETSGISHELATELTSYIVSGASFMTAAIVAWIFMHLLCSIIETVASLPVIHGVNKSLGLLVGGVQGILLIWLIFLGVALGCQNEYGQQLQAMINENWALTYLYDHNLLLSLAVLFV